MFYFIVWWARAISMFHLYLYLTSKIDSYKKSKSKFKATNFEATSIVVYTDNYSALLAEFIDFTRAADINW